MAEQRAVNSKVVGSNPAVGACTIEQKYKNRYRTLLVIVLKFVTMRRIELLRLISGSIPFSVVKHR